MLKYFNKKNENGFRALLFAASNILKSLFGVFSYYHNMFINRTKTSMYTFNCFNKIMTKVEQ